MNNVAFKISYESLKCRLLFNYGYMFYEFSCYIYTSLNDVVYLLEVHAPLRTVYIEIFIKLRSCAYKGLRINTFILLKYVPLNQMGLNSSFLSYISGWNLRVKHDLLVLGCTLLFIIVIKNFAFPIIIGFYDILYCF